MFNRIGENNFILNIEELVCSSMIIKIGEDFIEIPDIVIFSTSKSILHQFLNPSVDVLNISIEELNKMKNKIKEKSSNMILDSIIKPSSKVIINYEFLLNNLVFFKKEKGKIKINKVVFTRDKSEFYGLGVAGVEVFYINQEDFESLSSLVLSLT